MSETEKKSGLVDWGSVDAGHSKKSDIEWLRLKDREEHVVRLVHRPKHVLRYYNDGKSAICGDPRNCPVAIKHNLEPKDRYAIIVLDRTDANKVKIMEAPASVFSRFKDFWKANDIDPGGNDGPDFIITVKGKGLQTKYTVDAKMGSKPFTEDEKNAIRAKKAMNDGKGYNLDLIFAPTSVDKIEAQLGLVPSDGGSSSKASSGSGSTTAAAGAGKKTDDLDF